MRKMIRIVNLLVIVSIVLCGYYGVQKIHTQNCSGGYSSALCLEPEVTAWVMDRFGDCKTVEEVLERADAYAIEHFVYDQFEPYEFPQHFEFQQLITLKRGICYDFACWLKTVVLIWSEETGAGASVYVADVKMKNDSRHSYNFICTQEGRQYFMDLTADITLHANNKKIQGYFDIGDLNFKEYASLYEEEIYRFH